MKDLIQEGRKIQESFKKNVTEGQNLNENKIVDVIRGVIKSAKDAAKRDFDQYKEFIDLEQIAKDKPQISTNKLEALVSSKLSQQSEDVVNEGVRDFILKLADKMNFFDVKTNIYITTAMGMLASSTYIKYIKVGAFAKYYAENIPNEANRLLSNPALQNATQFGFDIGKSLAYFGFAVFTVAFVISLIMLAGNFVSAGITRAMRSK